MLPPVSWWVEYWAARNSSPAPVVGIRPDGRETIPVVSSSAWTPQAAAMASHRLPPRPARSGQPDKLHIGHPGLPAEIPGQYGQRLVHGS
jgi:hypothetical protein